MLKDLNRYENLGTPKFFYELFQQLSFAERQWTKNNIKEYFYNKSIDGQIIFDGCLFLAELIGAVLIDENDFVSINPSLKKSFINEKYLSNKILEMIISAVKNDEVFYDIFCPEYISYDIVYRLIQIDNAAFNFRYSSFRQLLINFTFLYPHPDCRIKKFLINSRYKKFFDKELMVEIKKRKIGISELEKSLEQKLICGREAENFVLKYEKNRLFSHPCVGNIEIISDYDVAAGYDVISYKNVNSSEYDVFIEVKSYTGFPNFHWSKNEIDVARIKKDSYFIYLVDREKIDDKEYVPLIIKNPFKEVIEKPLKWDKKVDSYFITKL